MSGASFAVKKNELKVEMEHVFDAPCELVFMAFTESELIPEWWGPRNAKTRVEKNDLRLGGAWRFVFAGGGREDAFYGVYLKIQPPELIAHTFNYEPIGPGHEVTETAGSEQLKDGRTKVTAVCEYKNIEDLERMVGAGMEPGASESYDRLGEPLGTLQYSNAR